MPAFLGIPYATAERFARPVGVAYAPGSYTSFGPAAPQGRDPFESIPGTPVGATSEDCLSCNVWAPEHADGLPVLFWVHGGSFIIGSSAQPVYDGARLAREQNVVVVSCNYRIGALGFLDTRSIGGDAVNLGLHDVLAALAWVQANIGAFGGDPARVTVFGESAGGGVVAHLLASARSRGLFRSAIVQSGITDRTLGAATAAVVTDAVCTELGTRDLDVMRTLPVDAIVAAQQAALPALLKPVGMMPFHPTVDDDLLHAPPAAALAGGVAAGVPLVAGTTSDEMRLFVDPAAAAPERERLLKRVARYIGVSEADAVWPALFSDVEMQVPLRRVLDAHAAHAPVYTYLFTWEAPGVGAAHGVDIPFTFGNFSDGWEKFVGADDAAERLSREMRDAWAAFARDGEPGWSPYPSAYVFGRESSRPVDAHPLFARLPAL
ncbi:MAG TPA: carboxylesterase family protein [Acidimicrobiia bacterium]|nr:carboxylesterase family protein [Acidimicrobiia bacterium]